MRLNNPQRELFIGSWLSFLFAVVAFGLAWHLDRHTDPNTMFGWLCGATTGVVQFLGVCCLLASFFFGGCLALSKTLNRLSPPRSNPRPKQPNFRR